MPGRAFQFNFKGIPFEGGAWTPLGRQAALTCIHLRIARPLACRRIRLSVTTPYPMLHHPSQDGGWCNAV